MILKNILILIFKKEKECIELKRVGRDRHPCLNSVRRRLTTAYRSASGQALAWSSTHSALSLRLQSNLVPSPLDMRNVGKPYRYVQCLERSSRWILRSWCGEKRSWKQEREEGFRSVVRCGVRYCYALLYRIPHQYYFDDLRLESENWVVSKRKFQS